MITIFLTIIPLFAIILLGAILQKTKVAKKEWLSALNDYALYIGLPALIFSALSRTTFVFSEQRNLILINSVFLIASFLVALVAGKLLRLKIEDLRTLFICFAFGNIAYLGIPVLTQIYTKEILPTASLIVAIYLFWMFTLGVGFLDYTQQQNRKNLFKKIFIELVKNPLLIAVVAGITVSVLGLSLPQAIYQTIDMIALSVTPVVLIVVGLFMGKSKLGKLSEWIPVFLFSSLTLFVLPLGLYLGIKFFGFSVPYFSSTIIQAGMPLAITTFALADKYKLNKPFIMRTIVLSTALSIISIPFWATMLLN